jgi:hypothetical protein
MKSLRQRIEKIEASHGGEFGVVVILPWQDETAEVKRYYHENGHDPDLVIEVSFVKPVSKEEDPNPA